MGVAVIVLAAGGSRRMGEPKLPLAFRGRPLIHYAVDAALASRAARTIVVTGCARAAVEAALAQGRERRIEYAHNPQWRSGLASSLRAGLKRALEGRAAPEGVAVVLGDQPALRAALLDQLIAAHGQGARIAACDYGAGELGPPALFDRSAFPELQKLRGDRGARELLRAAGGAGATGAAGAALATVPFPAGRNDINTPAQLRSR